MKKEAISWRFIVTPIDITLRLQVQVGTSENGDPLYRVRSYRRVKPSPTDQDVLDVAQALASLQDFLSISLKSKDKFLTRVWYIVLKRKEGVHTI